MRTLNILFGFLLSMTLSGQILNGFDLAGSLIPSDEILKGGPPRDGIPSIDDPKFSTSGESVFSENTQVLGIYFNEKAKAYPISILNWHEIVNDDFDGEPISVTYCPLCGSGMAYHAKIDGKATEFGVSGLLFNSDVLLYDRNTNSLWSQILNKGVTGKMKGQELTMINTQRTSLGAWKKLYPETLVLTTNTGFSRDYNRTPYAGYDKASSVYFPVQNRSQVLHEKEWIIGVKVNGSYKAYPISELRKRNERKLKDKIGRVEITLTWDRAAENIEIKDSSDNEIIGIQLFWFAWFAFYPETEVWSAD